MSEKTKKVTGDEKAVLAKIDSWPAPQAKIGRRLHALILDAVPGLKSKLWYGAAGYGTGGPTLVFFRLDERFSFGLTEKANVSIEDGAPDLLIGSAWYLTELDAPTEARIVEIVKRAVA
ncbi:MAG: hypothetical protein Q7T55_12990 [Solirubrobacteraceae bacterium]|nr:hypothetical protein [Solirubrobacteraceae bacterium]